MLLLKDYIIYLRTLKLTILNSYEIEFNINLDDNIDLIIVLGGDGTILRCS